MLKYYIRRVERILENDGEQAAKDEINRIHKRYQADVKKEFKSLYK